MSVENKSMWDLDIYEIKIDSIKDGLSFRRGQKMRIKGEQRIVTDIIRIEIEGEMQYQIFSALMGEKQASLTKVIIGMPVYLTFDV